MAETSSEYAGDVTDAVLPLGLVDESWELHPVRPASRTADTPHAEIVIVDPRGYAMIKRSFDIVVALTLLVLVLPLWLIVAALIWATSPGPIIFRQERIGRGGQRFICLKFRSMVESAEAQKVRLLPRNEVSGPVFKLRNDPRITAIGRFLRRSSLDEAPQLINVLAGDMSIVGPRPPLPEEVAQYAPHHLARLAVKPGLTCIWQVSGRSLIGFEEWMRLDIEYIRRRGFWLDLLLVVRTIPAVIRGRGAC